MRKSDTTEPFHRSHLSCLCAVMGSFEEGERVQSVSQGDGAVVPAPRIRSFPQPQVTWYRDGRKIPPSSRM